MAINSVLTLQNQQYLAALEAAGGAVARFAGEASIQMRAVYQDQDYLQRGLSAGIGRFANELKGVGQSLSTYVTLPIVALGVASIQSYAKIDSLNRGLLAVEGTALATAKAVKDVAEIAKLPGLGLVEATQGYTRLRAVGFSALEAKASLLQFGNAIATTGGGKAELGSVLAQLTQMASKSKVLAEDLKPVINASPIVAQKLKEMFGTIDAEEISKKLQAIGKTPKEFISMLTGELANLPRVSTGIGNAIENMGDAALVGMAKLGEAIDKALNVSGIINQIGDSLSGLAEWFSGLDPAIQKAVSVFAVLVAAIGPVIFAVGSLGVMFAEGGILYGGLMALTGPIGLVVGGVVLLATAIISNWEKISQVLKDTGIWSASIDLFYQFKDALVTGFEAIKELFTVVWSGIKDFVIPYFSNLWGAVLDIFRGAIKIFSGVFQVLKGVFTLNFSEIKDGVVKIFSGLFETVINLTIKAMGIFTSVLGKALNLVGVSIVGDQLLKLSQSMADMHIGATKTANAVTALGKAVDETSKKTVTTNLTGVSTGKTDTKKTGSGSGKSDSQVLVEEEMKKAKDFAELYNKSIENVSRSIVKHGLEIKSEWAKVVAGFNNLEIKIKPIDTTGLVSAVTRAKGAFYEFQAKNADFSNNLLQMNQQVSSLVNGALTDGVGQFGEFIGNMIAGTEQLSSLPAIVGGIFGDLAVSIGKALIAFGTAGIAIKFFEVNPTMALIAGAGLVALGSALKASVSSARSGGSSGSTSTASASSVQSAQSYKMPVLQIEVTGSSTVKGSDIYTSYTNASKNRTVIR